MGRIGRNTTPFLAAFCVLTSLLAGCATTLPSLEGRTATTALTDTASTRLGRALADDVAAHPGKTGVHPLGKPRDAFAARALPFSPRPLRALRLAWRSPAIG